MDDNNSNLQDQSTNQLPRPFTDLSNVGSISSQSTSSSSDVSEVSNSTVVPSNWIPVKDGKFTCSECENESAPETNTAEGVVTANLDEIKQRFLDNPGMKLTVYGICPVCGMEYEFRYLDANLYLEPSAMMK